MLKASKSWKQIILCSIFPKNEQKKFNLKYDSGDVSAGATGATEVPPKFSDTFNLS